MSQRGLKLARARHSPVSGTSVGLITLLICSMLCRSGERPPCMVKIFSSMIAAIGRQLKQSVKVFHSLMLNRLLPGGERKRRVSERTGSRLKPFHKDAAPVCRQECSGWCHLGSKSPRTCDYSCTLLICFQTRRLSAVPPRTTSRP